MNFIWFAKIVGTNKKHIMKQVKINVPEGYQIDKDKSTFENIVFKKKKGLPKSWNDLVSLDGCWVGPNCELIEINSLTSRSTKNTFKTEEQAEASIALAQLSQLRDVYRQGWKPDWTDDSIKYNVEFLGGVPRVLEFVSMSSFLSFQDRKTAYFFLENFRDLIKQAKPLMS